VLVVITTNALSPVFDMIWELSAGLPRLFKCVFKSNPLLLEDETNQTTSKEHHQAHALLVR